MRKIVDRYLAAAGSVMDIMPDTDYWQYAATGSDFQAISGDVNVIANDMNRVIKHEFKTPQARGSSQKTTDKGRIAKNRC